MTSPASTSIPQDDWYLVEQHEANPLFDLVAQTSIDIRASREDDFSLVESSRPSFAQVAALKSARSSVNPTPIPSPIMRASRVATSVVPLNPITRANKYGTEYTLKKSGKKYIAMRS